MKISAYRKSPTILALPFVCLIRGPSSFCRHHQAAFASPGIPDQFFGTITINGSTAPAGYTVTANDNGVATGVSTTTDSQGRYGYSPVFVVPGSQGDTITFFVNGVQATTTATFQSGGITTLNLIVSGSVSGPQEQPHKQQLRRQHHADHYYDHNYDTAVADPLPPQPQRTTATVPPYTSPIRLRRDQHRLPQR